jgi:hypothetical protein
VLERTGASSSPAALRLLLALMLQHLLALLRRRAQPALTQLRALLRRQAEKKR